MTQVATDIDVWAGRTTVESGSLFDTGKVKLWYHDDGNSGEPVVLVGGFTAGHFAFDFVRPHLPDHRLITWEPRGLGRSDHPDPSAEPYGTETWAADLRDLLAGLGVDRAHLWGAGFGSYIVLRFAAEYGEATGAVVTYSDVWHGDPAKGYARIWNVYRAIVENFGTKGFGARVLANIFDVSDLPWFGAWEAANIEDVLDPDTVEWTVGYGLLHADVRTDLARITAPTLVLQGDRTWDGEPFDESRDASVALMRERIPSLEVATIEGAHPAYVLVQKPQECARVVREFLERHAVQR
jgi:pimeloyl-ACP methyl ester carboxylesterase